MVDMHIHTVYSDGTDTVKNIFELGNKLNITTISITDHNTILAYEEIINNNLMKLYNGNLISGVELKCYINKEIIEILIYDFEIDKMKTFIDKNYINWENINKSMSVEFENILISKDIKYDKSIMISHDFTKYNGIMELCKSVTVIKSNEGKLGDDFCSDITEFCRKSVGDEHNEFYVDLTKYYPSLESIINFVKQSGGKIFMPHVYLFNNGFNILKSIHKKYIIDGVECYHPSYTLGQCNELLDYCRNNNLYISGGSDYHGNNYQLGDSSKFYDDSNIKLFDVINKINCK